MAKYNPFDPANGYSEEDRLALNGKCASLINQAYKNPFPGTKIRLDGADNAGIFFAKQLAHVKTKAYDKDFPELSGLKIFPQTSETDEGAAYIEYYSYEPVGFADVIANYASDLPRVDVKGTPHRAEIVNIGDSYGYNVQELRACRRNAVLGIMKSLDSARAEAARRVYDVKVNHLIWHGDEKTGIIGVLSSGNNIPIYTLQNGAAGKADWASKTADEIAADIAGMEMRDITVGEYQFKVRPFGAKDATYIFGDVASIILPILGTVSVASDDKDAVNMEMFDGMDMDKDSLVKALARINGNALSKLVSELLLDHSNIRVLDPEKNTYEVMGEDDFDEIFCQYLAGMLNLCAEVIRLNFSGFFKDASTLFGGLIKVRRAGSSNSTESSTTTE